MHVLTERRPEALGLTPEEVLEVRRRLGREPNPVEWRILAVMWSCLLYTSPSPRDS